MPRVEKNKTLSPFLYRLARFLCWVFFKLGWRLHVIGHENIPKSGSLIIAANHRSLADPPLIGVSVVRFVHFLAKEELFEFGPFGWLITQLNAHPLSRGKTDLGAFKAAKQILGSGELLIVFPEGRRSKTDKMGPAKPGVGLLASMMNCPVLPAYIENSAYLKDFKKITVRFGKPVWHEGFADHQAFAEHVVDEIKKLHNR